VEIPPDTLKRGHRTDFGLWTLDFGLPPRAHDQQTDAYGNELRFLLREAYESQQRFGRIEPQQKPR